MARVSVRREVPRKLVEDYVRGINELSAQMRERLIAQLQAIDLSDFDLAKQEVMELMRTYCAVSTDAAGRMGAEYYRLVREWLLGGTVDDFDPSDMSGRVPEATDEAVRAILQKLVKGQTEQFVEALAARLDFETRRAALDNTVINSRLDPRKPKLQRMAQGGETCDFCLMLCSKEPGRYTAEHVHANCDCKLVPVYGSRMHGYDYQSAYDRWQDALYDKATSRAERNGTTVEEEKQRIIAAYEESSRRNKQNARVRMRG